MKYKIHIDVGQYEFIEFEGDELLEKDIKDDFERLYWMYHKKGEKLLRGRMEHFQNAKTAKIEREEQALEDEAEADWLEVPAEEKQAIIAQM